MVKAWRGTLEIFRYSEGKREVLDSYRVEGETVLLPDISTKNYPRKASNGMVSGTWWTATSPPSWDFWEDVEDADWVVDEDSEKRVFGVLTTRTVSGEENDYYFLILKD